MLSMADEYKYRALVEWCSQGGKLTYSETNLSQRHLAHHKSHIDRQRIKPRSPQWEVADCLRYGTAS